MTQPVACRSIDGYEQFERLPGAALTSEEKLQVYFRPVNYKVVHEDDLYKIHFSQDGQIRRKGEKPVLRRKKNILDYESKTPHPLGWLFLRNSVPLKGLAPGTVRVRPDPARREQPRNLGHGDPRVSGHPATPGAPKQGTLTGKRMEPNFAASSSLFVPQVPPGESGLPRFWIRDIGFVWPLDNRNHGTQTLSGYHLVEGFAIGFVP